MKKIFETSFTGRCCSQAKAFSALAGTDSWRCSSDGGSERALTAPCGHGRRPHPCLVSSRLRFCPVALIRASQFTRQRRRKRKRLIPCHCLPSAKDRKSVV